VYLDWHSRAAHAKLYYLPKSFLIRLINELTEVELHELARDTAKNDLVDISLFLRGGFTMASVSNIAETWLKIAQMPYRFEINEEGCKIIIEHDMGIKYSYLIKEISRYLLEVAFETKSSSCNIRECSYYKTRRINFSLMAYFIILILVRDSHQLQMYYHPVLIFQSLIRVNHL
jgi:hypothetical protein